MHGPISLKKAALREYREYLHRTFLSGMRLLIFFVGLLVTLPALWALPLEAADLVWGLILPIAAARFAEPLYNHARAVHVGTSARLRVASAASGMRALRLYRRIAWMLFRRRRAWRAWPLIGRLAPAT